MTECLFADRANTDHNQISGGIRLLNFAHLKSKLNADLSYTWKDSSQAPHHL